LLISSQEIKGEDRSFVEVKRMTRSA